MADTPPVPVTIVIFGASGDLTYRKLIPALYNNFHKGRLPQPARIVGFARRPWDNDFFAARLQEGTRQFSPTLFNPQTWDAFAQTLHYFQGNLDAADDYQKLRLFLQTLEQGPAHRLYYLATAPKFYGPAARHLGAAGMADQAEGWRNIVVEKPFGRDLASAQALNRAIHAVFNEGQVYRIDHYLGKETAQNIIFFRFANTIFEPVWNRRYVKNVQISVTESVDIGHRAGYYDRAGVLRDMFQNHLLQLLTLIAMEPPASLDADAVRNEKAKVLSAIRPVAPAGVVRAQYRGYCEAPGVAPNSGTATYAALKLHIDNWRWQGVPFYLRSGKALRRKHTEITIQFQAPPDIMFNLAQSDGFTPNTLSICVQPDEGIHLKFETKVPDSVRESRSVDMEFHYRDSFGDRALPDAYERLLLDALKGDASLFARSDEIELAWRLIDPILAAVEAGTAPPPVTYQPGSWGPPEADALLAADGAFWRLGCGGHQNQAGAP
ncbi:MAG: glucose-6-phosphate dehydrogenase [Anaerolineae bacterium]